MDLGGMSPRHTDFSVHESAGASMASHPTARTHHNPFHLGDFANALGHVPDTSSTFGGPGSGPPVSAPLSYRAALTGVTPPTSHPVPSPGHLIPPVSQHVPSPPEVPMVSLTPAEVEALKRMAARADAPTRARPPQEAPKASLTPAEVKVLKGMAARVEALEQELRDVSLALLNASRSYQELHNETTDLYDAIRVAPLHPRPARRAARDELPMRDDPRPSRADRRH